MKPKLVSQPGAENRATADRPPPWPGPAGKLGEPGHDDATASASESAAQLRMAVEMAGIASWRHDLASGRIQHNDQGWAILGLAPRPEGMSAREQREVVHPEDLAELLRLSYQARQSDQPVDIAARFRHVDKGWRYVLMRCSAQRDAQGRVMALLGVSMDMSERFAQTQRENELSRRLEMATNAAGVGVWSFQPNAGDLHWDLQMRRLHGGAESIPPASLGAYLRQHVHVDDRDAVAEGIRTLVARRVVLLDLDFRVLRADGTLRRVATRTSLDGEGELITLNGVMLDVTERHDAEARLRESDQRFTLATRGAGIGTWELSLDGEWVWWDEQMFRMRGLAPRPLPLRASDVLQLVHPEDQAALQLNLQAALTNKQPATYEFRVVLPDGKHRWMASRSSMMRDERGQPLRRIGINWDVTDVRATAAERQDRLLAQRESQAKSRFLARMSHELRTPLNAVIGFAQLLLADGAKADGPVARQRLGHILSAGEHLLGLINEVLDLSSLESGELPLPAQAVALRPLIDEVMPLVENLALQHDVRLHRIGSEGTVRADPTRMRQVLINLLTNGIKYNRPGGSVTVDAKVQGAQVLLQVRDTGRGLTEAQLRRLFEPFNRLGAEHEGIDGSGIGLAIVLAAVRQMGGTVQVSSEPDIGTCFEVQLPLVDASAHPPTLRAMPATPTITVAPATQPSDVLYIEDNAVNVLIVAALVRRRSDLVFHEAMDGASGIAAARRLRPALVLIDMQLPDMDGIDVLHRLRADAGTADLRCVALSANAMQQDIHRALDAGFDGYWTKPLDFAAFAAALEAQFGPAPSAMARG